MIRNVALVEDLDGDLTWHRAECPEARKAAASDRPVLTMIDIRQPVPRDHRWHSCMEDTTP